MSKNTAVVLHRYNLASEYLSNQTDEGWDRLVAAVISHIVQAWGGNKLLPSWLMGIAKQMVDEHIEEEDGEKCFNLFRFLEDLENDLEGFFASAKYPCGKFELNGSAIARYLWCCMALEAGDMPDGNTYKGIPILD